MFVSAGGSCSGRERAGRPQASLLCQPAVTSEDWLRAGVATRGETDNAHVIGGVCKREFGSQQLAVGVHEDVGVARIVGWGLGQHGGGDLAGSGVRYVYCLYEGDEVLQRIGVTVL